MGRAPCCSKVGLHRGPWTPREDNLLINYIQTHGEGHWRSLPKNAGLLRCGKSCRLRWMNYLRPDIKRGNITQDEDDLIIRLHSLLGNRWSLIAGRLPGRTDNEIKNYWNTHLSKRLKTQGSAPNTQKKTNNQPRKKKKKNITKQVVENNTSQEKAIIKVHQPKPIRVSSFSISRNDSFESNISSGSSTHIQQGHKSNFVTEVVGTVPNWFGDEGDINGIRFLVGDQEDHDDHDHDLVNGSDYFECIQMPKDGNSLDKLYEEYFELLKSEENHVELESFAESLLI